MTNTEAKDRLRQLLNEASEGFYTDPQLFNFLDTGMNEIIAKCIGYVRETGKESLILRPLLTLDGTTTVASGSEANLVSGGSDVYLETFYVEYSATASSGSRYPCVRVTFPEGKFVDQNLFSKYSVTNPAFYIRADKIGFFPAPDAGTNNYQHYYYKKPAEFASGTTEIAIGAVAHDAIIYRAYANALLMDDRSEEATLQRTYADTLLAGII